MHGVKLLFPLELDQLLDLSKCFFLALPLAGLDHNAEKGGRERAGGGPIPRTGSTSWPIRSTPRFRRVSFLRSPSFLSRSWIRSWRGSANSSSSPARVSRPTASTVASSTSRWGSST